MGTLLLVKVERSQAGHLTVCNHLCIIHSTVIIMHLLGWISTRLPAHGNGSLIYILPYLGVQVVCSLLVRASVISPSYLRKVLGVGCSPRCDWVVSVLIIYLGTIIDVSFHAQREEAGCEEFSSK